MSPLPEESHASIGGRTTFTTPAASCVYPTTDELGTPDGIGRYNHFTRNTSIYWTPTTDAHLIYRAIREHWSALGWETSWLGYPTSNEYPVPPDAEPTSKAATSKGATTGVTTAYRHQ